MRRWVCADACDWHLHPSAERKRKRHRLSLPKFLPRRYGTYNGQNYTFAAFGFSGGTLDLEAANISASLVFALNSLGLTIFTQAVTDRWLIKLRTVWLNPDTLVESSTYSEEVYAVTGLEHDNSRLSVRLGSPLDAIRENAPRRSLTQQLVGALPTTGEISLQ